MKDHEHKDAVALMKWVKFHLGRYPCLKNLIHIPNGGLRNMRVAKKLKAEGVKAGVSDYLLPVMRIGPTAMSEEDMARLRFPDRYPGLWIELKANGNKPTPEQHEWMNDMRDQGYAAFWCDGWVEATEIILAYLNSEKIPGRKPKERGTYVLKKDKIKVTR